MTPAEAIKILEEFNKESEYLFGSKFNLQILSDPEIGRMTHEKGVTSFTQISDYREELNAFGMVYRMFIQQKDRISFDRMEALYKEAFVPPAMLQSFLNFKQQTEGMLSQRLIGSWDGAPESYARLHEIIMYGYLAHRNDDKVGLYEQLQQHHITSWLAWTQFAMAINYNMIRIQAVQRLNERLMVHLAPIA